MTFFFFAFGFWLFFCFDFQLSLLLSPYTNYIGSFTYLSHLMYAVLSALSALLLLLLRERWRTLESVLPSAFFFFFVTVHTNCSCTVFRFSLFSFLLLCDCLGHLLAAVSYIFFGQIITLYISVCVCVCVGCKSIM